MGDFIQKAGPREKVVMLTPVCSVHGICQPGVSFIRTLLPELCGCHCSVLHPNREETQGRQVHRLGQVSGGQENCQGMSRVLTFDNTEISCNNNKL